MLYRTSVRFSLILVIVSILLTGVANAQEPVATAPTPEEVTTLVTELWGETPSPESLGFYLYAAQELGWGLDQIRHHIEGPVVYNVWQGTEDGETVTIAVRVKNDYAYNADWRSRIRITVKSERKPWSGYLMPYGGGTVYFTLPKGVDYTIMSTMTTPNHTIQQRVQTLPKMNTGGRLEIDLPW